MAHAERILNTLQSGEADWVGKREPQVNALLPEAVDQPEASSDVAAGDAVRYPANFPTEQSIGNMSLGRLAYWHHVSMVANGRYPDGESDLVSWDTAPPAQAQESAGSIAVDTTVELDQGPLEEWDEARAS